MKKSTILSHGMIALSLIMSMNPAQARLNAVAGIGTTVAQSPGEYSFKKYDETKLQTEILNILEKRSAEDKAYVENSVRLLNMAVNDLINENLRGGLQKMSDDSTAGGLDQLIDPLTFLAAKRSFDASIEKINTMIGSVTAIPSVMQANSKLAVQGRIQEIQNRFNINLSPLIKSYEEQISAIITKMNGLSFKLKARNGKIIVQTGLNLSSELTANQYTAAEISQMRRQATAMRVLDTREQRALDQFNLFTLNVLNSSIDSYGKAYRSNMDEAGKASALKMIEGIFFARSIMRAQYGLALGAPSIAYDLKSFNWDFFGSDNHVSFNQTSVRSEGALIDLHNRMVTALKTQDARTKEVFGSDSSVFSKITSAITFLKGERARSGMNVIMLKLLVADLEEEMTLAKPGGRRELKSMIQARYYATKDSETYFKTLGKNLSGTGVSDAWSDVGQVSAETLPGIYRLTTTFLKDYASRITQAVAIEESLAELDKVSGEKVKTINDDLFN